MDHGQRLICKTLAMIIVIFLTIVTVGASSPGSISRGLDKNLDAMYNANVVVIHFHVFEFPATISTDVYELSDGKRGARQSHRDEEIKEISSSYKDFKFGYSKIYSGTRTYLVISKIISDEGMNKNSFSVEQSPNGFSLSTFTAGY